MTTQLAAQQKYVCMSTWCSCNFGGQMARIEAEDHGQVEVPLRFEDRDPS